MVLYDLEVLKGDDTAVARLWAIWTDPRRGKVVCEGFRLRAGQEDAGKEIFRAQYADCAVVIANLKKCLEQPNHTMSREGIEKLIRHWEGKQNWTLGPNYTPPENLRNAQFAARQRLWIRATELSQQRVMEFAGDPFNQMCRAGSLTGRCCQCGRMLTDPKSVEYGIGPECRQGLDVRTFPGAWWLKKL